MTETGLRRRAVEAMASWLGAVPGSAKHAEILATYNAHKPLARGYAIRPGDAYCAATVSAAWLKAGVEDAAVLEVSVPKMTELAQKKGIWVERDDYVPAPGDAVVYDWQDDGKGDNTGRGDHVGLVESVGGGVISVIEGNMGAGHLVGRRTLAVDGKYIRGFICPDYKSLAEGDCHCEGGEAARGNPSSPAADKPRTAWVELPVLRRGSSGGHVKTLQILLNRYNKAALAEDGVFGGRTDSAVKAYQTARGLAADGVVGVLTWTQLLK